MAFNTDIAATQVQERQQTLSKLVHSIEKERIDSATVIDLINRTHDKISSDGKLTFYYQHKLKTLYNAAITDGEKIEELIREALTKINEIRQIRHEHKLQARSLGISDSLRRGTHMKMLQSSAQTLPLWVSRRGESPPPLCAAIPAEPSYIAKPGDMVAALVKGVEDDENWILAEVVLYDSLSNKYEVDDIDEVQKERYVLSRRKVIPLPLMKANPETEPEALFPVASVIMALYPQTTCFYKGIVNRQPATPLDDYEIIFEDASYADGFAPPLGVAQRYVLPYKECKKKAPKPTDDP